VPAVLIPSRRYSAADLAWWERRERVDRAVGKGRRLTRLEDEAVACVLRFLDTCDAGEDGAPRCHASLSCGKDSTVLVGVLRELHRRHGVTLPVIYVRVSPHENPDNALVLAALRESCADALARLDVIDLAAERDPATGEWVGTGRLREGFDIAAKRYGAHRVTGIRADESSDRQRRDAIARKWERLAGYKPDGTTTRYTCAPLTSWTGQDVFAYLASRDLPVHPTYACTFGGRLDRTRLRVATLGGWRGGTARYMHEQHYYGDEMEALGYGRRGSMVAAEANARPVAK
jgi:phosphoadenosine phosphosulfate reductase